MIALDLETAIDRLRGLIGRSRVIVPFTGAGISTECGIPDFRSPGGLWTKNHPIPYDDFISSRRCATKLAATLRFGGKLCAARPGRGHRALASLHRAGKIPAVITQNIDNLHQVSGFASECVVELHGNTTYAICLGCDQRYELAWVRKRFEGSEKHPIVPAAAVTSNRRQSHSVNPCRLPRCSVPKN